MSWKSENLQIYGYLFHTVAYNKFSANSAKIYTQQNKVRPEYTSSDMYSHFGLFSCIYHYLSWYSAHLEDQNTVL